MRRRAVIALTAVVVACTRGEQAQIAASSSDTEPASEPADPAENSTPSVSEPTSAPPEPPPSGGVAEEPAAGAPTVDAGEAPAGPDLPAVVVANIGLHVGGGPNDGPTKKPFQDAIAAHFDGFKRCFALVQPPKGGTVGVDLRVPADGGTAMVQELRSGIPGKGFADCMRAAFAAVAFERPPRGATVISYSLRFTPEAE